MCKYKSNTYLEVIQIKNRLAVFRLTDTCYKHAECSETTLHKLMRGADWILSKAASRSLELCN